VPVWGFAMLWMALAAAVTLRAARVDLPFSPAWWSFTFPVGTVVTGTSALALHTGSGLFRAVAVLLYALLVGAWAVVGGRTLGQLGYSVRPQRRVPHDVDPVMAGGPVEGADGVFASMSGMSGTLPEHHVRRIWPVADRRSRRDHAAGRLD